MDIWDEVSVSLLLIIEIVDVYAMSREVSIKLGLFREVSLVYFLGPEWMLP